MTLFPRKKPPLAELSPRRVCLIKPSALGDIVQTLPVLSMLRARFPEAHIAWVVKSAFSGILKGHPDLDEVIPFETSRVKTPRAETRHNETRHAETSSRAGGKIAGLVQLLRRLRRERFDLTIDLQGLLRSGLMTWAAAAPRRVGFANAREGAPWTYTDKFDVPIMQPALERYRQIVAPLGCQGEPPRAIVPITDDDRRWAAQRLDGLPRPLLAIHPGAQWETKRWPPQHFAELARRAQDAFGAGVVLVGGKGEGALAAQTADTLEDPFANVAEQTSLLQLAAVCESADVFLSGDTGPMHLAAAVGATAVAVFTCTSPRRAAPRGPQHEVVTTSVACAASYLKKCRRRICMEELSPERVWPALERALESAVERRRKQAG